MAKELHLEGIETSAEAVDTKATKTAEEKAAERQAKAEEKQPAVEAGIDFIKGLDTVSDKVKIVLDAARVWNVGSEEEVKAAKETMFEALGGAEAGKEYLNNEFQSEVEGLRGLNNAISVLNTIYHFYKKREGSGSGTSKAKKVLVELNGANYFVSQADIEASADLSLEEKKAYLMEKGTKQEAAIIL